MDPEVKKKEIVVANADNYGEEEGEEKKLTSNSTSNPFAFGSVAVFGGGFGGGFGNNKMTSRPAKAAYKNRNYEETEKSSSAAKP